MTIVHTAGGQTVPVDIGQQLAGTVADALAAQVYGHPGEFSLKVDGQVLARNVRVALGDDSIVELVDVTGLPDAVTEAPAAEASPDVDAATPADE